MPTAANPAWKRLGDQLVHRRAELDPAYANRQKFSDVTGLNYRTIADIEKGRRDDYRDDTIASVEAAYQVKRGSVRRTLDGYDLEALPAPSPQDAPAPDPAASDLFPGDETKQRVLAVLLDPELPDIRKLAAIAGVALYPDNADQAKITESIILNPRLRPAEYPGLLRMFPGERERLLRDHPDEGEGLAAG